MRLIGLAVVLALSLFIAALAADAQQSKVPARRLSFLLQPIGRPASVGGVPARAA
jgi:hypothetical protein